MRKDAQALGARGRGLWGEAVLPSDCPAASLRPRSPGSLLSTREAPVWPRLPAGPAPLLQALACTVALQEALCLSRASLPPALRPVPGTVGSGGAASGGVCGVPSSCLASLPPTRSAFCWQYLRGSGRPWPIWQCALGRLFVHHGSFLWLIVEYLLCVRQG